MPFLNESIDLAIQQGFIIPTGLQMDRSVHRQRTQSQERMVLFVVWQSDMHPRVTLQMSQRNEFFLKFYCCYIRIKYISMNRQSRQQCTGFINQSIINNQLALYNPFRINLNMLPPGLHHHSPHHYATLTLTITRIQAPFAPNQIELLFYGCPQPHTRQIAPHQLPSFKYPIVTDLWSFYQYLREGRFISLRLYDGDGEYLEGEFQLYLREYEKLMGREMDLKGMLNTQACCLQSIQTCVMVDKHINQVGKIMASLKIEFDPIIKLTALRFKLADIPDQASHSPSSLEDNIPSILQSNTREQGFNEEMDQKGIEEDIDRMIAEINSKPYDSSKYLQSKQEQIKQNCQLLNFTQPLVNREQPSPFTDKQIIFSKPPKPQNNYTTQMISLSPFKTTTLPSMAYTVTSNQHARQPVSLKDMDDYSPSVDGSSAWQRKIGDGGAMRLRIHELTTQRPEKQVGLLLRVYLNEDACQFYSVNGVSQGEAVSFQSSIAINQQKLLNSLRFQLIDTFDFSTVIAIGRFDMQRLWSLNSSKGTFMVNLIPPKIHPSQTQKVIKTDQKLLVKVIPNIRNLRIDVQLKQKIDIVQIYLSLSQFDSNFTRCSYKIPMTKQKIQFKVGQSANFRHINIFPHNRGSGSEKLIVEFWGQTELIGYNQICLKSTWYSTMSSKNHQQPITLIKEYRNVVDLLNSKTKGRFYVKVQCGTIGQIQSLINGQGQKQRRMPVKQIPVQTQLGIYVKQNKLSKQISIQVDQQQIEPKDSVKMSKKQSMDLNQQQQLPSDQSSDQNNDKDYGQSNIEETTVVQSQGLKYNKPPLHPKNNGLSSQPQLPNRSTQLQPKQSDVKNQLKQPLSLTKQFQVMIKEVLLDFTSDSLFDALKKECASQLLYNFIEEEGLVKILRKLGMQQQKIDCLMEDILMVSNEMININMLYDMVFGLILDQEVKEKFIEDHQLGKFCLKTIYASLNQQEPHPFVFDHSTQFNEVKQLAQLQHFRITMRQFNLIHKFIQEYIAGSPKFNCQQIKQRLIDQSHQHQQVITAKHNYHKQVAQKIYSHEWDEQDNFFISNINKTGSIDTGFLGDIDNQLSNLVGERQKVEGGKETTMQQSKANYDVQKQQKTEGTIQKTSRLNEVKYHESNMFDKKQNQTKKSTFSPASSNQHQKLKKSLEFQYKLTLEGFQQSVKTIQCLLNRSLKTPKIHILSNALSQAIKITTQASICCQVIRLPQRGSQWLQGSLQLLQEERVLGRCNFSLMLGMKSCYSLKSVQTMQFCGILKLLVQPHE